MSLPSFDPMALPQFPLAGLVKQFENAWSIGERLQNITGGPLDHAPGTPTSLYEDFRQTHLIIAHTVQGCADPASPFYRCSHFSIQDEKQTMCIMLHVLGAPRVAPDSQASHGAALGSDLMQRAMEAASMAPPAPDPPGPLLPVRFAMCRKSEGQERVVSFAKGAMRARAGGLTARPIKASTAELRMLARTLRGGARRMAPDALARHAAAGAAGGGDGGFWTLSFLGVPPPTPEAFSLSDAEFLEAGLFPCSCGCEEAGQHGCSGCKGAVYASRECQRRHWREHKAVCPRHDKQQGAGGGRGGGGGAAASASAAAAPQAEGPSVLLDLTHSDFGPGVTTSIALRPGGVHRAPKEEAQGEAPLNRHGSARFIVKAQRPTAQGALMLLYDETRGLDHFVSPARCPQLEAAIAREPTWGGFKAYFFAVREGDALRVFTGKCAPTQAW